jgi:hypothetical protein
VGESLIFDLCDMLCCCFILCGIEMLIDETMNSYTIVCSPCNRNETKSFCFRIFLFFGRFDTT